MPGHPKQSLTIEARRLLALRVEIQKLHTRRLRQEAAKMRKGDFAERLGLGEGQLHKLETGKTLLTAKHLARYGAALGMGIVTLDTRALVIAAEVEGIPFPFVQPPGHVGEGRGRYEAGRPRPDSARSTGYWVLAGTDARACEVLAQAGLHAWACFAAYAAALSAVRAVVVERGGDPSASSVHGLLQSIARLGVPTGVSDAAVALDNHRETARDPAAHDSGHPEAVYSSADARHATERLKTLVDFCRKRLPGEPPLP